MKTQPAQETRPKQHTTTGSPAAFFTTLGGRKFALVVTCIILYTVLLVLSYVDQAIYLSLQTITVGAFLASNTIQKFSPHVDR